jgi:hypothetical protein
MNQGWSLPHFIAKKKHCFLLPLFRNKCQGIVLESMTSLDFRDTYGHLFPNKGSIV